MDVTFENLKTQSTETMRDEVILYCNQHDYALALEALAYATDMHRREFRLDKSAFISHPLAVTILCILVFDACGMVCPEVVMAIALLHDVCENRKMPTSALPDYPKEIIDGVSYLTLDYGGGPYTDEWKGAVKREYYGKLDESLWATFVKMMDRYHNLLTVENLKPKGRSKNLLETQDRLLPAAERALARYGESEYCTVLRYAYDILKELNEELMKKYAEELRKYCAEQEGKNGKKDRAESQSGSPKAGGLRAEDDQASHPVPGRAV